MKRRASRGFTLVELLIVIVVIAILAAITIVAYNGVQARAHASALQADVAQAVTAIKAYGVTYGQLPAAATDANVKAAVNYYPSGTSDLSFCVQETGYGQTYYATNTIAATSGSCTVSDGLVGEWKFDGNATDSVASDNGTVTGATLTTGETGLANGAYQFDGSSNYISIPTAQPSSFGAFTVSAWVNSVTTFGGGYSYAVILSTGNTIGASVYYLGTNTNSDYSGTVNGAANNTYGSTGQLSNDGQWHLLTLTYDGTTQMTYLDGQEQATSAPGAITNGTTGASLTIGAYYPINRPFKGAIDDVRIYNRALSATDVATLYAAGAF